MKKALFAHGRKRATAFDWINDAILLLVAILLYSHIHIHD